MLGGLAHSQKPIGSAIAQLDRDRSPVTANHGFMDKVAVHNYFWAWQTFGYLYPDRAQLDAHGFKMSSCG